MDARTLLWITAVIMLAGGLFLLITGKRRTPSEELHTVCHGIVPLIAACSYMAMASGQGSVLLPVDGAAGVTRVFYYARYADWAFTTPLLLLTLSNTAVHGGVKRPGAMLGVILADLIMIVTAFAFGASVVPWLKWTWFLVSCAAFLGVYYVIWVSNLQANAAERDDVRSTYRRNATILSVLWLLYPVALAVSPDGLGTISEAAAILAIAVLDVVSKVVYGFMTVTSDGRITERDLAEPAGKSPRSIRAAA